MDHRTEYIAGILKEARKNKGLSQRALSERAGMPQGHISKIENGAVDLRLSSLIELARALDLELALVPRRMVPAVQMIVGAIAPSTLQGTDTRRRAIRELDRLQGALAGFSKATRATSQFAQLQRQLKDLRHFRLEGTELESIRQTNKMLDSLKTRTKSADTIAKLSLHLQSLRNALAHRPSQVREAEYVRPAYSLDEGDDDA